MKRRNADCSKLRRQIKRNKITEGMYGSTTVLYMKFLVLWAIVITADFMFMFRFEFLWPFWLILRHFHDTFKYRGVVYSVLFVCIAITSDLVCLFFIPVHWLLFAASTYVWVQYVWHTDKGICLPTIILWMLFVYLEAGIRWKDSRHLPHLDLCRPFAANCIGYPVLTFGIGVKTYVGYRIRLRKQREVAKENEFYMELLRQALPQEVPIATASASVASNESITSSQVTSTQATSSNATTTVSTTTTVLNHLCAQNSTQSSKLMILSMSNANAGSTNMTPNGSAITTSNLATQNSHSNSNNNTNNHHNHQQQQQNHTNHQNSNSSNHFSNGLTNHNNSSNSISTSLNHGTATTFTSNSFSTATANTFLTSTPSSFIDDKPYEALNFSGLNGGCGSSSSNIGGGATANGHIGVNSNFKSQRRSADKEHKNRNGSTSSSSANETECKRKNTNNLHADSNSNNNNNIYNGKEKDKVEMGHITLSPNVKEKNDHQRDLRSNSNSSRKSNTHFNSKSNNNDNHTPKYELDELVVIEPVERTKGRRNRSKKDNAASKDNQHSNQQQQQNINNNNNILTQNNHNSIKENGVSTTATTNNNFPLHNSDASSVSSISSSSTTSSTSLTSSATSAFSNIASKVVSKICESCLKFEADVKKYRSEISHMKQIENELRQKLESNLTTKSCLQAKQKECDELEKRVLELTNARHADFKASERRLTEERRQKQSLEAQLNNEKKARKIAEEKAARPECSVQCKQRKQQLEDEVKILRRDLKATDEAKLMAEQHGRKWEQELRMFEAEIRNRDSNQQPTEMLMNALAAMQDKNCTLEKNLSAETRVKLDLFSALGDAKRQLEISESRRRSKEDEVHDLKAKIAQLLAVMPTDTLCLPACNTSVASSMIRMNDTPPLQTVPGPASPMLSNLNAQATSNVVASSTRAVPPTSPGVDYVQSPPDYVVNQQQQHQTQQHQQHQQQLQQHLQHQLQQQQHQQQKQQQCSGLVPVSVANSVLAVNNSCTAGASSLDPNATVYTPKTLQTVQGGVVVVGATNVEA